jgi:hypothetical protein
MPGGTLVEVVERNASGNTNGMQRRASERGSFFVHAVHYSFFHFRNVRTRTNSHFCPLSSSWYSIIVSSAIKTKTSCDNKNLTVKDKDEKAL